MTDFRNRFYGVDFHNKTDEKIIEERTQIDSDFAFSSYVYKFMRTHADTSEENTFYHMYVLLLPIISIIVLICFLLRFSVNSSLNFRNELKFRAAYHGDDICYIFW